MTALASTAGEDRRSMDQATRGEKDEEIAVRAEKEDGTGQGFPNWVPFYTSLAEGAARGLGRGLGPLPGLPLATGR
jgi:hypothetical protein